jgi:hypothetical protein
MQKLFKTLLFSLFCLCFLFFGFLSSAQATTNIVYSGGAVSGAAYSSMEHPYSLQIKVEMQNIVGLGLMEDFLVDFTNYIACSTFEESAYLEITIFSDGIFFSIRNITSDWDYNFVALYSATISGDENVTLTITDGGNVDLYIDSVSVYSEPWLSSLATFDGYWVIESEVTGTEITTITERSVDTEPTPTPTPEPTASPTATSTPISSLSLNVVFVKTLILLGFGVGFIYKIYNTKDVKDLVFDILLLGGLIGGITILFM